ncbi:hypothetical protein [Aeromonas veronii]|uniref:hypothetical protein n=1 Tax=Aeromonas veronii TaxID=654 RepID=UPI0015E7A5ED|nr:hypothetical protein [Aeromonas veronii]MBA2075367.1 hypothetical protein [Aeromonas veronii]
MRIMPLFQAACLSLMLSACVAPLLMMGPTSQLMWALLKPLVGFDPNEVNLFEQPLIKDRMTAILGPNYDSTMQLLKTANELQQEGPLFYVVSRYAPVPDIAKQAGMVWNSQTNQMSVLLQKGDGTTQTFGENLAGTAPTWPTAMQGWQTSTSQLTPAANALTGTATSQSGASPFSLGNALGTVTRGVTGSLTNSASQAISGAAANATGQATQAVSQSTTALTRTATTAVTSPAKQAVSSTAATATQEATKAVTAPAKQAVSSAATTVTQEATKAVVAPAKQTVSSAAATVTQEATKAVADPAKQAVSAASHSAGESVADAARAAEAKARAKAEAEMEALLK